MTIRNSLFLRSILTLVFASAFAAGATAQVTVELIGDANSSAQITNGDLQDLTPFAGSGTLDFTPGGGMNAAGGDGTIFFDDMDLETLEPSVTLPIVQVGMDAGAIGEFIEVPGFRLTRTDTVGGGSGFFGFDNSTGLLLDDGANVAAIQNNGNLSLATTDGSLVFDADIGAGTTFTLAYDVAVDGAQGDDTINFEAVISGTGLAVTAGTPTFAGFSTGFTVNADNTVTGFGTDLLARVEQTFTVDADSATNEVTLAILFGEELTAQTGGVDRGGVDNIELTAQFFESQAVAGDVNGDGLVLINDFEILRDNFLNASEDGSFVVGEATGAQDGVVDFTDFLVFREAFAAAGGNVSLLSLAAVPEPGTATVLLIGLAATAASRRKAC